jgi:hypothetical protein
MFSYYLKFYFWSQIPIKRISMTSKIYSIVFTLLFTAVFSTIQASYTKTADSGKLITVNTGTPPVTIPSSSGSLTTLFAGDNSYAGNMFDLAVIGGSPITINSLDVNVNGSNCQISVYYRTGSYVGHESSPTGWTLISTLNVNPIGLNMPTPLDINDVTLAVGQTYGFYVTISNYASVAADLNYTNGSNTYSNPNLQLTAGIGKGEPDFTGSTFTPRTWNGTIHYTLGDAVPVSPWVMLSVFGLIAGVAVIRFRNRIF